jgi:hypothetical protein
MYGTSRLVHTYKIVINHENPIIYSLYLIIMERKLHVVYRFLDIDR